MGRQCETCGRGSLMSSTRSHSNIRSPHRQFANIQSKSINGKRMKICTRCLRTLAKVAKAA